MVYIRYISSAGKGVAPSFKWVINISCKIQILIDINRTSGHFFYLLGKKQRSSDFFVYLAGNDPRGKGRVDKFSTIFVHNS